MKQVIIKLRDCRPTYYKTLRKRYYYSQSQYHSEAYDDFKDLMPGQEIYIKFGNKHDEFITYEEVQERAIEDNITFDEELWYVITINMNVDYWLHQYLPQY